MQIVYLIILFAGGILSGLYASVVGSGGLVSLPLVLLTGLPINAAIATNKLGIVFLEFVSAWRFYRQKKIRLGLGLLFALPAALGSVIGANLVIYISTRYLNLIAVFLFVIAFVVVVFRKRLGSGEKKITRMHWTLALIATFFLGIYGGFFGIGFGTFITFIFVLTGLSFMKGSATSRVVGFIMSVASALVFAFGGLINYPYALALGFGFSIGSWIGVGLGIRKGNEYIRVLFIMILLAAIVRLVLNFLT